jgi:hypothetical protein
MQRTYLASASLAMALVAMGLAPRGPMPAADAAPLFGSAPLDGGRFAVLARPVGQADWTLLVLEQVGPQPRCWLPRADGLVDPSLNRFDYSGICGRYLDSNGYSLRAGGVDLAASHRLRLQQQGDQLLLLARSSEEPRPLVVARGAVPSRQRDGFVALQLEPGWELQRRLFAGRSLNHLYFANARPIQELDGAAAQPTRLQGMVPVPSNRSLSMGGSRPTQVPEGGSLPPWSGTAGPPSINAAGSRAISLQVIPFME